METATDKSNLVVVDSGGTWASMWWTGNKKANPIYANGLRAWRGPDSGGRIPKTANGQDRKGLYTRQESVKTFFG
jgi:hypothetical protein